MKYFESTFKTAAASCLAAALCFGSAFAQTTAPANPALNAAEKAADATAAKPSAADATAPALDAPAPTATAVSDAKLNQFADAYVAVQNIQKESVDKAPANTDPAKAQVQAVEMQSKMKNAVEKSGLQVEEFNQIAQAMLTDLDLRAKVAEKVQARTDKS